MRPAPPLAPVLSEVPERTFERRGGLSPWGDDPLMRLGNGMLFVPSGAPEAAFAGDPGVSGGGCLVGRAHPDTPHRFAGETTILPNAWGLSWRHDGESDWFVPAGAQLSGYRHWLSMDDGAATREATVTDAAGRQTRWQEVVLVSLTHANVALLRWALTPLNWSGPILVRSQLDLRDGHGVTVHNLMPADGLAASVTDGDGYMVRLDVHLHTTGAPTRQAGRSHETDCSYQQRLVEAPLGQTIAIDVGVLVTERLAERTAEPARDDAPVDVPTWPGFEQERVRQRAAWQILGSRVRLSIPSDRKLERDLRLGAFHLLQAVSPLSVGRDGGLPQCGVPDEDRPSRDGDAAWLMPFFSLRLPALSRELVAHHHRRLDLARAAAADAGLPGALFPGHADTALVHALWQHHLATHDHLLLAGMSGELIVAIAAAWQARADRDGAVPRMALQALRCAAALPAHLGVGAWRDLRARTGATDADAQRWEATGLQARLHRDGEADAWTSLHLLGGGTVPDGGPLASEALSHVVRAGALAFADPSASWAHFLAAVRHPMDAAGTSIDLRSMAAAWDVLQRHYLGIFPTADGLTLQPRLPEALDDVTMRVSVAAHGVTVQLQGRDLTVRVEPGGTPLAVQFAGERRELSDDGVWTVRCR